MDPAPPVSNIESTRIGVSAEKQDDVEMVEMDNSKVADNERQRIMPASLRNVSEADLKQMEKKLVRKMDFVIMYVHSALQYVPPLSNESNLGSRARPIVAILYILNFLDRANLGAAKVQGIMKDLHLSTQQFAACISLLYGLLLPHPLF